MKQVGVILILCVSGFMNETVHAADYITHVTGSPDVLILYGKTTSATLRADVKPSTGAVITRVWAEIYPPIPVSEPPIVEFQKIDIGDTYEAVYTDFTQEGDYLIDFIAEDSNGVQSEPVTGVVRRQELTADDYEPDDTVDLARQMTINAKLPQLRNFHNEGDTDWVIFLGVSGEHYTITANNTNPFSNAVIEMYESDGITLLKRSVNDDSTAGTKLNMESDCQKNDVYAVKVKNYNFAYFGETIQYELSIQRKIAGDEGYLRGTVINGISRKPIQRVKLWTTGRGSDLSGEDGTYNIVDSPCDDCILIAEAAGYETIWESVKIEAVQLLTVNITMFPGDVNGDGIINLSDSISALQIISAGQNQKIYWQADINEDKRIGLVEVIYILQKIVGI